MHVADFAVGGLQDIVDIFRHPAMIAEFCVIADRRHGIGPGSFISGTCIHRDVDFLPCGNLQETMIVCRGMHFNAVDGNEVSTFLHVDVRTHERSGEAAVVLGGSVNTGEFVVACRGIGGQICAKPAREHR